MAVGGQAECDGHSSWNSIFPLREATRRRGGRKGNGSVADEARDGLLGKLGPGIASQQETGHLCPSKSVCALFPCAGQHHGVVGEKGDGQDHSFSKY